jgi:hypothetical protein
VPTSTANVYNGALEIGPREIIPQLRNAVFHCNFVRYLSVYILSVFIKFFLFSLCTKILKRKRMGESAVTYSSANPPLPLQIGLHVPGALNNIYKLALHAWC